MRLPERVQEYVQLTVVKTALQALPVTASKDNADCFQGGLGSPHSCFCEGNPSRISQLLRADSEGRISRCRGAGTPISRLSPLPPSSGDLRCLLLLSLQSSWPQSPRDSPPLGSPPLMALPLLCHLHLPPSSSPEFTLDPQNTCKALTKAQG